jgi:hypothetical protein
VLAARPGPYTSGEITITIYGIEEWVAPTADPDPGEAKGNIFPFAARRDNVIIFIHGS